MLKKFYFCILFSMVWLSLAVRKFQHAHQKMVLSISKDLFIKNVILLKSTSFFTDAKTISFLKKLSQSNIYTSSLSKEEIELKMGENVYGKSIIVEFEKEFNNDVYGLISKNEMASSKFLWLVWRTKNQGVTGNGFYIPYNCQLLIAEDNDNISYISEMYHPRVNSSIMFRRHFGIWSTSKGLEVPEKDFYKRRFNMNGTALGVLYETDSLPDFWLDIIKVIVKSMNFRHVPIYLDDYNQEMNLSWEIKSILQIFDHTMGSEHQVLGLIWKTSVYMYIRYDQILENRGIAPYTRPFSKNLWQAILTTIAFAGIFTFALIYIKTKIGISTSVNILSALCHPLEAFTNQCGGEDPQEKSTRIAILTIRLTALFIVPAYSAFILTFILYPNLKLPFTSMQGFVQDGSYKMVFATQLGWDTWFKNTNDSWSRLAYEKFLLESNEMPQEQDEVDERICHDRKKFVFLLFQNDVIYIQCEIVQIQTSIMTGWYGYPLREKSPYKTIFNRVYKMFHSAGIFDRYEKRQNSERLLVYHFDGANEEKSVEIESIESIIQLMTGLYIISVTMLLFEWFNKRCTSLNVQVRK